METEDEKLLKVLSLLELIVNFSEKTKSGKKKKNKDVYELMNVTPGHKCQSIGRHCVESIVYCISNHRYEEASKLYWILCQDKKIFPCILFNIGIVLFSNSEADVKQENIKEFFLSIYNFMLLNKKEVLLEFIVCALKSELPALQIEVKKFITIKLKTYGRKNEKIDPVFDAYRALLDYVDYCQVNLGDIALSQNEMYKSQAASKLKNFLKEGSFDIFVLKLVELMNSSNEHSEIENLLIDYAENNLENINSLIYICTYLYHNQPDSDQLLKYLEILSEKCISDVRVLWLIELWNEKGINLLKGLNYCFMFLDYPSNGNNIQAWKILWENLGKAQQNLTKNEFQSVLSLWDSRKRSWMWMYFNTNSQSAIESSSKLLIAYRVAFLSFFAEGKKFVKKVSKVSPDILELVKSLRS